MNDQSEEVYTQGNPASIGLLKKGKQKIAPRLLSAEEEMRFAAMPNGKLAEMAQDRLGTPDMQEPTPGSPEFFKRRNNNGRLTRQA